VFSRLRIKSTRSRSRRRASTNAAGGAPRAGQKLTNSGLPWTSATAAGPLRRARFRRIETSLVVGLSWWHAGSSSNRTSKM